MIAHAVTYETRNAIGAIVEEIDSIWLSASRAVARRKEINGDPAAYPGMVADTKEYVIRDFALVVPPTPQDRPGRPTLSADDVRAIRERYAAGESLRALSRAYGVTYQSVSEIVNRKTWRHV